MAELPRSLTRLNATAMVAGTIIGASIFVQPSEIARHLSSPGEIMLVWLACGVLTLFGAFVCAELASAFPQTGGLYVFLRDTFSPLTGFLWGWAMFWSMHSGIVAAIAVVFARYAAYFVPGVGEGGIRLIAIAVILALSALNYVGVKAGSRVQTALTIVKIAAIAVVVVGGLLLAGFGTSEPAPTAEAGRALPESAWLSEFLLAMVAGLFAYGGWHMVTYTAGETVMPARTIPTALVVGVAIVTVCYVALNVLYLAVLPLDAVRTSTRIAADAADAVVGTGGSALMSALVVVSSLGGLTGIVLTGPRVYYSMAGDGLAFRWLDHVHPVYRTPSRAIVAQAVWASVLAGTGAYRQLFTRVIYTEWLFFALMAAGLFVLRRQQAYQPEYRAWGYPAVPIVFIVASLVIVINQIVREPVEALTGLGIVALGAPIYYLWHANR
ncbi:MAG TPA: amino acid permease [Vicinamibacterales bacterium]|nr:amino acid permease [Vicinamibacterales bacterium]